MRPLPLMARARSGTPALVAGLCVVVLAVGACGGDGDGRAGTAAGRATTSVPDDTVAETTTTVAAGESTTTVAGGGARTSTTRRAGTPTTTGSAAVPPAGSTAVGPARAGTYRFNTTGSVTVGATVTPLPAVTTLVVDPPAGSRQHWRRDLRDPAGNGSVTEITADYRPEGIFLEELKAGTTLGGFTQGRTLRPPSALLFLPTGAVPGHHLDLEMSVIGEGAGVATVTVDVLREEPVAIGGTTVQTLVVKVVVVLPPGDVTGRTELTVSLDRASGLFVRDQSVSDASAGLFKLHSEYQATLQSLTPA